MGDVQVNNWLRLPNSVRKGDTIAADRAGIGQTTNLKRYFYTSTQYVVLNRDSEFGDSNLRLGLRVLLLLYASSCWIEDVWRHFTRENMPPGLWRSTSRLGCGIGANSKLERNNSAQI